MPERLEDITVTELSLVPKGAVPGTDFVQLAKESDETVPDGESVKKSDDEEVAEPDNELEKAEEPEEKVPEPTSTEDLAKELIGRMAEVSDETASAITDAILAKISPEDPPEEPVIETPAVDPLCKRIDGIEELVKEISGSIESLTKTLGDSLESLSKAKAPESLPEEAFSDEFNDLMGSVLKKMDVVVGDSQSIQAKTKVALGEDPGDTNV